MKISFCELSTKNIDNKTCHEYNFDNKTWRIISLLMAVITILAFLGELIQSEITFGVKEQGKRVQTKERLVTNRIGEYGWLFQKYHQFH